ncbi:MAG: hypothetical protein NUW06_06770, partial [Candidatus Acetothermia bacterium]|nr:hypothetical protein [Candidatus Acetothermia bacterium]
MAVLALLALATTGCTSAIQQLIGLDRGGVSQDGGVTALDSEGSDDSEGTGEADVVPLSGKERKAALKEVKSDEDFALLRTRLASLGLKMRLGKAEAYEVITTEESEAAAQALGMEGSGGEEAGTLVDIPFGNTG